MAEGAVLEVRDLRTAFRTRNGEVHAVNGAGFSVAAGECLGVVGESGSGKSVTMMSIIGLLPSPPAEIRGGSARFMGRELIGMEAEALRRIRGREIGFVFQDPMTSLNPVFTVGFQLMEPLRVHLGMSRRQARARAAELLDLVGIPDPARRLGDYPHQFSGGMRQRVMIAMALACEPRLLIADEPTTALDVTIQAQILELMQRLRRELGMALVWITHDLGVVAEIADRVAVMYAGRVVEEAAVEPLFAAPRHPYTRALLAATPHLEGPRAARLRAIEGQPPMLARFPTACPFRPRCRHAMDRCAAELPELAEAAPGHRVACFWSPEDAPAPTQQEPAHA